MNKETFEYTAKTNWVFVSSFIFIFVSMIFSLAWLFPTLSTDESYTQLLQGIPDSLRNALGVVGNQTSYFGFMSANYFNSLHLYFMMAFVIMLGQELVSKPIDDTSLSFFLSGSLSRSSYLSTRCIFLIAATVVVSLSAWLSMLLGELIFASDDAIPWKEMGILNFMLFLVFSCFASIVVFVRMLTKSGKEALAISSSIIITEYCLSMASALSPKLTWLKNLTLFSLLDTAKWIDEGALFVVTCVILVVATLSIFFASGWLFKKKDLYL